MKTITILKPIKTTVIKTVFSAVLIFLFISMFGERAWTQTMLNDFEDEILWLPGGSQDIGGYGRGWAFTWSGAGDMIEIDNIGANGTNHSLKLTFASENNDQIYFRSNDKTTDHMPEADGANRMSFYVRFPADFPIQPLPFRYDTWQLGTYIHDPNNWSDLHGATDWDDHGIHHYYARLTIEQVGDGWVKYIINTQPDQCNYGGSTVPPNITHFFDEFGRFYFHFGEAAGGPNPTKPYTIWIDEIKFYHDDGSVGGQVHTGGLDDDGFDGEWFPDYSDITHPSRSNPDNFTLQQNYPNPFNHSATIKYSVTKPCNVQIKIFNQLGQEVCTLINEHKPAGNHFVTWDGKDNTGKQVSPGMYYYHINIDGKYRETRNMLMIK